MVLKSDVRFFYTEEYRSFMQFCNILLLIMVAIAYGDASVPNQYRMGIMWVGVLFLLINIIILYNITDTSSTESSSTESSSTESTTR